MNFDLSPEHELVRSTVREFAEQRVAPVAEELDREHRFPYELVAELAELAELRDELVREAAFTVELFGDGRDPLLRELAHGRADELVLLVEIEVQLESRCASSTISRTP